MPLQDAEGKPVRVEGSFAVSAENLVLTSSRPEGEFTITNNANADLNFVITKVVHREFTDTGVVTVTANPMHWLKMGVTSGTSKVARLDVTIPANGGTQKIIIDGAVNPVLNIWEGDLQVANEHLGMKRIRLRYASKPTGQWSGKIYYLANFGTAKLDAWVAAKRDVKKLSQVGNAFIQKWGQFRLGYMPYEEFSAMLTATLNESWKWASVRKACPSGTDACYLSENEDGISRYSVSLDSQPIPTGILELPMAVNIQPDPLANDPMKYKGKIVTAQALQYGGDPALTVTFANDPSVCSVEFGTCLVHLNEMSANVFTGGRYLPEAADKQCSRTAAGTFKFQQTPWLIPGFRLGTETDSKTGLTYVNECRDQLLPFGANPAKQQANMSFAGANPIPDGRTRRRRIDLVDGAIINQESMFVIFREQFDSFLGSAVFGQNSDTQGFTAYGVMMLSRSGAVENRDDFVGAAPSDTRTPPNDILKLSCAPPLVQKILGNTGQLGVTTAQNMVRGVILGVRPSTVASQLIAATDAEKVHYYCEDTGMFDGGTQDDGTANATRVACPVGSRITYFTLQNRALLHDESCNAAGTCQETLNRWQNAKTFGIRMNPVWRCADQNQAYCDDDRLNLRNGKSFFKDVPQGPNVLVPLLPEVDSAFRYKTRFRSRTGGTIGFAPQVCVPGSDVIPYCYDPPAIEQIKERVDCAISIYTDYYESLDDATKALVKNYLVQNFSHTEKYDPLLPEPIIYDGFERLNAELLTMMGDESYTNSFAARFDLANTKSVSFEGSKFEPNGINLSGGAGYEMYSLYQAIQYYQMALDRFYALSPVLWGALSTVNSTGTKRTFSFITQRTVTSYIERLVRASTQKSRAWSEVSKRYQNFNRPDLARLAVERAYTATYLESIVMSRMMNKISSVVPPEDKAQIFNIIDRAQLMYKAAMLDMRAVYSLITDDINFFGLAPDYIPFPALDDEDGNAFKKLLSSAQEKTAVAGEKEQIALNDDRQFETDAAVFQAELAQIRQNYENQLDELCGNFTGDDGEVYPAIPKYAELSAALRYFGNPCGMVGNGAIHNAMANVDQARLDAKAVSLRIQNLIQSMRDDAARLTTQCQYLNAKAAAECEKITARKTTKCNIIYDVADYRYSQQGAILGMDVAIRAAESVIGAVERATDTAEVIANLLKCNIIGGLAVGSDCPSAAVSSVGFMGFKIPAEAIIVGSEVVIAGLEAGKQEIERQIAKYETRAECEGETADQVFECAMGSLGAQYDCDFARLEADATAKEKLMSLTELQIDALKAEYNLKLALSELERMRASAVATMAEQSENEQLAINIEAARNDPNVRIYKNDAIITASRTFDAAVREAYKATKVYEYYTSQSYARLDTLFLVRMVAHGDYTLENYLAELSDAYSDFEEQYGNPDLRVHVLSLKDDILNIARIDAEGRARGESERVADLHRVLTNPAMLDGNGYLTIPFNTSQEKLSPLTRNHKIAFIEAEITGSDTGDTLGRVYLRQKGTGIVAGVTGDRRFYRFPERTAVINTFFNGDRETFAADDIFASRRLQDRPLVNTQFELVFNQRDENVNADINVQSINDIKLYFYYTDFTKL